MSRLFTFVILFAIAACNKGDDKERWGAKPPAEGSSHPPGHSATPPTPNPPQEPAGAQTSDLDPVLAAYERARALLASDQTEGLAAVAADLRKAATTAAVAVPGHKAHLQAVATAAPALASSADLAAARKAFGEISRPLVALVQADAGLAKRLHIFNCSMADGYGDWVQPSASIENPYMGKKMLACGTEK